MTLKKRNFKQDILLLKWQLGLLAGCILLASSVYGFANYYRTTVVRSELIAHSGLSQAQGEIEKLTSDIEVISANIQSYQKIVEKGMLQPQDRVGLLEQLKRIREQAQLFPIDVTISEQSRNVLPYDESEFEPDEQISLLSSELSLQTSLLHEGDLVRLVANLLEFDQLLLPTACHIVRLDSSITTASETAENQQVNCSFRWLTLRREPFNSGEVSLNDY